MTLKTLLENFRKYEFRIKSLVDLDEKIDEITRCLTKYNPLEIGKVKKTIIQKNPLDFKDIEGYEVFIMDIVLGFPASNITLKQELVAALNTNEKFIVVRSDNDPIEIETSKMGAFAELVDKMKKEKLFKAALLSTESSSPETNTPGKEMYGNSYNMTFLKYLSTKSQFVQPNNIVDINSPLLVKDFPILKDAPDHNKDITDAPKTFPWWMDTSDVVEQYTVDVQSMISNFGNFDDDSKIYTLLVKDSSGKTQAFTLKNDSIRKKND